MLAALALALALNGDTTRAGPVRAYGPRSSPDSWTHDVGHVVTMVAATPAFSLWLKELGVPKRRARWLTLGTMVGVMVLKEVHDERVAGGFSGRDLATGSVGIGVGMIIAERLWRTP